MLCEYGKFSTQSQTRYLPEAAIHYQKNGNNECWQAWGIHNSEGSAKNNGLTLENVMYICINYLNGAWWCSLKYDHADLPQFLSRIEQCSHMIRMSCLFCQWLLLLVSLSQTRHASCGSRIQISMKIQDFIQRFACIWALWESY